MFPFSGNYRFIVISLFLIKNKPFHLYYICKKSNYKKFTLPISRITWIKKIQNYFNNFICSFKKISTWLWKRKAIIISKSICSFSSYKVTRLWIIIEYRITVLKGSEAEQDLNIWQFLNFCTGFFQKKLILETFYICKCAHRKRNNTLLTFCMENVSARCNMIPNEILKNILTRWSADMIYSLWNTNCH